MKRLWNEHIKTKLTFIIVFLLLFNFIVPTYSQADYDLGGAIFSPFKTLIVSIGDAAMWLINWAFTGNFQSIVSYGLGNGRSNSSRKWNR